jgi:hypothetical protein
MTHFREPGARGDELHALVQQVLSAACDVGDFCAAFERVYNLETDKTMLSERERSAFKAPFERIVWYSPFPDERRAIPNNIGEDEVLAGARAAAHLVAE